MRSQRVMARAGFVGAWAVLGACGLARGADSVSAFFAGLPGDAVDAYSTGEQRNEYVLDLTVVGSSWGNGYGVGPLAKASRGSTNGFFTHVIGSAGVSAVMDTVSLSGTFAQWSGAGAGVSSSGNVAPGSVTVSGSTADRFGAVFFEQGGGPDGGFGALAPLGVATSSSDDSQNVIGVVARSRFTETNRWYVSRVNAATNKKNNSAGLSATASFGVGGVDADGTVHALADAFDALSSARVQSPTIFRVETAGRNANVVNHVDRFGFDDNPASDLVVAQTTPMTTPAVIPSVVAGRPVAVTSDLGGGVLFESTAGSTTSTSGYLSVSTDQPRGTVSYTAGVFGPTSDGTNDAGTCATLVHQPVDGTTRGVQVWGVDTDGSVDGLLRVMLPTTLLVDPEDGFSAGSAFPPLGDDEFAGYRSQVGFRGGNGPVALTVLDGGDLLAGALVSMTGNTERVDSEDNLLAVARVDVGTGGVSWTIAAHTGGADGISGKALLGDFGADGVPNTGDAGEGDGVVDATPIGRVVRLSQADADAGSGPSISAPAFDRAGNVYFIASVSLKSQAGDRLTRALIRGNRVDATGGYRLEVLLAEGDRVVGADSLVEYAVSRLNLADADSIDSAGVWSNSVVQGERDGVDVGALAFGSPLTLGAMVVSAEIVYDVDVSGTFVDPSKEPLSGSTDEAYQVLLLVAGEIRPGDFSRDGVVAVGDILDFLSAWSVGDARGDINNDGVFAVGDILDFLSVWAMG